MTPVSLDAGRVAETADVLSRRVRERFPDSSLGALSLDLVMHARGAESLSAELGRPRWLLRAACLLVVVGLLAAAAYGASFLNVRRDLGGLSDFVQGVDALLQSAVFSSVAVWSMFSLESRLKRSRVLRELRHIRALAHVVDMHQLDKDPMVAVLGVKPTESSPERRFDRRELSRYLEYCSEMLALSAKLAALYVQRVPDPACLEAASDIEKLCLGLSQKIWQKISMLDPRKEVAPARTDPECPT